MDDTKKSRLIRSDSDANALQVDFERVNEWRNKWEVIIVHVGKGNTQQVHNKLRRSGRLKIKIRFRN